MTTEQEIKSHLAQTAARRAANNVRSFEDLARRHAEQPIMRMEALILAEMYREAFIRHQFNALSFAPAAAQRAGFLPHRKKRWTPQPQVGNIRVAGGGTSLVRRQRHAALPVGQFVLPPLHHRPLDLLEQPIGRVVALLKIRLRRS